MLPTVELTVCIGNSSRGFVHLCAQLAPPLQLPPGSCAIPSVWFSARCSLKPDRVRRCFLPGLAALVATVVVRSLLLDVAIGCIQLEVPLWFLAYLALFGVSWLGCGPL